jgi:hypothetical protein
MSRETVRFSETNGRRRKQKKRIALPDDALL